MKQMTNFDKVMEFHRAFNHPINEAPENNPELVELRMSLIEEECDEVLEELDAFLYEEGEESKMHLAKELADILYVVYGTAVSFGINLDLVFHEVHKSNMSKLDEDGNPIYREDGKVLKSERYVEPELDKLFPKKAA